MWARSATDKVAFSTETETTTDGWMGDAWQKTKKLSHSAKMFDKTDGGKKEADAETLLTTPQRTLALSFLGALKASKAARIQE